MFLAGAQPVALDTAMAYVQANTNGRLHPAHEPSISPLNRGFLYGDAIYEVWRTHQDVIFAWEEHWVRLERSAGSLYMELPVSRPTLLEEIRRTVAAFREHEDDVRDLYIRLQVTRGCGAIGLDVALADASDFVILVQPNPGLSPAKLEGGLVLSVATSLHRNAREALNPAWKTGNYLNNILCLREARSRGADEVVITNLSGEVTEAAVSNIAFVADGRVITPPLDSGILEGVTRRILVTKVAPSIGVEVQERVLRPEELGKFDECFLMSTTKDLAPVACIDRHRYRVGESTLTRALKRAFANYVSKYAGEHRGMLWVPAPPRT